MVGFLQRMKDRKARVDLFISNLGWIKGATITSVNADLVGFIVKGDDVLGSEEILWQLNSVIGAKPHRVAIAPAKPIAESGSVV